MLNKKYEARLLTDNKQSVRCTIIATDGWESRTHDNSKTSIIKKKVLILA